MNTNHNQNRQYNNIFNSKEEMTAFRLAWKRLYHEGKHVRVRTEYNFMVWDSTNRTYSTGVGFYMASPLNVWHHLVYNIALGKDLEKAFGNRKKDLYWKIRYTKKDFNMFGDTLTPEQQTEISKQVVTFLSTI